MTRSRHRNSLNTDLIYARRLSTNENCFRLRRRSGPKKSLILTTLEELNGNRTRTAERLGISIRTLRNKLGQYRADPAAIFVRQYSNLFDFITCKLQRACH